MAEKIDIVVSAKDQASSHFNKVQNSADKLKGSIGGLNFSFEKTIPVVFGVTTILAGLAKGFSYAIESSKQFNNAFLGLETVSKAFHEDANRARQAAIDLAKDGLLTVAESAEGLKNLIPRMGLEAAIKVMNGLTDAAAFNRQGTLDLGQAVVGATQGIKNLNSIMVDNCLPGETQIITVSGNMSIKDIVSKKIDCSVYSYNWQTQNIEQRKIINWWDNGIKDLYEIEFVNGDKISATNTHSFYSHNGKKKRLFELKIGDELLLCQSQLQNAKYVGKNSSPIQHFLKKDSAEFVQKNAEKLHSDCILAGKTVPNGLKKSNVFADGAGNRFSFNPHGQKYLDFARRDAEMNGNQKLECAERTIQIIKAGKQSNGHCLWHPENTKNGEYQYSKEITINANSADTIKAVYCKRTTLKNGHYIQNSHCQSIMGLHSVKTAIHLFISNTVEKSQILTLSKELMKGYKADQAGKNTTDTGIYGKMLKRKSNYLSKNIIDSLQLQKYINTIILFLRQYITYSAESIQWQKELENHCQKENPAGQYLTSRKIKDIKYIGKQHTYNITVDGNHNYFISCKNGQYLSSNSGVTKNLDSIMKEYGFQLQDLDDKNKKGKATQILVNGLLKETAVFAGDAKKILATYQGQVAQFNQTIKSQAAIIGNQLTPAIGGFLKIAYPAIKEGGSLISDVLDSIGLRSETVTDKMAREWMFVGRSISTVADLASRVTSVQSALGAMTATTADFQKELAGAEKFVSAYPFMNPNAQKELQSIERSRFANIIAALQEELTYLSKMQQSSDLMTRSEKARLENIKLIKNATGGFDVVIKPEAIAPDQNELAKQKKAYEKAIKDIWEKPPINIEMNMGIRKLAIENEDSQASAEAIAKFLEMQTNAEEAKIKRLEESRDATRDILADQAAIYRKHQQEVVDISTSIAMSFGEGIGDAFRNNEPILKGALKSTLSIMLSYLEKEILIAKVSALIKVAMGPFGIAQALMQAAPLLSAIAAVEALKGSISNWQQGTPYIQQTGPYVLHQGERVMSATDNTAMVKQLAEISQKLDRQPSGGGNYTINAIDALSFQQFMRREGYAILEQDIQRGRLSVN